MKFIKLCPHILLATMILLSGCTRDDICDPNEATTPLLIITFKNNLDRDEAKSVTGLTVLADYRQASVIESGITTDSIAIPMRTVFNDTQYQFILAATATSSQIIDVYKAEYLREDTYINRACGFKTIFNDLAFSENVTDSDNDSATWIDEVVINQINVSNENQSHITIYH